MNKSAKVMIDKAHEMDPKDPDIQRLWIGTLGRPERIKYLERYLAESNDLDADHRDYLASYLSYLKERAKQPGHSCRLVSKVTATQTPLVRMLRGDPTHLEGYGLSVALNGSKTNLLLDTGASGILVNRRVAERAGIARITEEKIGGIGDKGRKAAFIGIAESIRIGELEFQDCPVDVIENRSVMGGDGLIGANVFAHFLVEVNFPGEQLKLSELPKRPGQNNEQLALIDETDDLEEATTESDANRKGETNNASPAAAPSELQDRYIAPEMQSFSRVYRFGDHLLVPTRVGDMPPKLFLLDSGATTSSISPAAAREVTKVQGDPNNLVKGISGSVKSVYSANKAVLQFGHLRQENQDMLSFDMTSISDSAGTEVSGLLGFVTLRLLVVKIDYRDGLVDFDYDPKRFDHF
jgi:predicted aspartyl protease